MFLIMFQQFYLDFENNIYNELYQAQTLEDIGYGRNVGNVFFSDDKYVEIRTRSRSHFTYGKMNFFVKSMYLLIS